MIRYFFIPGVVCVLLFAAFQTTAQPYHYYFGNLHAHSSYSDGNKDSASTHVMTPEACYREARKAEHFDFLGISEHNHSQAKMHLANYAKGLAQANKANENGRFVCLYGMEYGVIKNGGHVLIYGMDKLIGWEDGNCNILLPKSDYIRLFKELAGHPGVFATLAHPNPTDYNSLLMRAYDPLVDQTLRGSAISSGPAFATATDYSDPAAINYYSYYKKLLALGYHVGPTMDHDNHYTTFGKMSPTRTVILSTELSRDSLIAAYRANRFYASEDWDTQVDFTVNGKPMGTVLKNVNELQIAIKVKDPDEGDVVKSVELFCGHTGSGVNATVIKKVNKLPELQLSITVKNGESVYYFSEIEQQDGQRIITSPVWVNNTGNDSAQTVHTTPVNNNSSTLKKN